MNKSKDQAAPSRAEIDAKVEQLLEQLTLEEKIEIMDADMPFWQNMVFMMGGGYNKRTWDAGVISRLGIEGVRFSDGPRGLVMEGATTFPVSMARGAAWDTDLEERVGEIIGRELRAKGRHLFRRGVHQPAPPPGLGTRPGILRGRSLPFR